MRIKWLLATVLAAACSGAPNQPPIPSSDATTGGPTASTPTSTVAGTGLGTDPATTASTTAVAPLESLSYEPIATGLPFPTLLTARPGDPQSYLITKDGQVWIVEGGGRPSPILDLGDRVRDQGEQGLLGMALHPGDPDRFFLHYSDPEGDTVVAEYRFVDPQTVDAGSERVLLTLSQPAANHNGGMIQFGPDQMLYLGLGDGGGAADVFGNGQNPDTLLAGIVRIDPDAGTAEKIVIGLRNPWRFWIDGDLIYIADVGQNAYEEVNVAALEPGHNFGWPITEGLHCFSPSADCDIGGLTMPVIEVEHGDAGACSITGGVVYRGSEIPELDGHYLYSDYCGGWLRSFRWDGSAPVDQTDWTEQVGVPGRVTSFGLDGSGVVHVLTTDSLLKLTAAR